MSYTFHNDHSTKSLVLLLLAHDLHNMMNESFCEDVTRVGSSIICVKLFTEIVLFHIYYYIKNYCIVKHKVSINQTH